MGQIVAAVGHLLSVELDLSDPAARYQLRVAARLLELVERELAQPELEVAHRQRLETLGLGDDAALAGAIRAGRVDDRWDEVVEAVAASVRGKLRVANPAHLDDPGRGQKEPDRARV